ncbi:membrane protein US20 [macacine betaherpesvirus 3]|uniref:Rh201 n=1 Tax=Rhesus cytomegalovirus (strain 68-1) TaxID=47929 RepID=Q2FA95_RHCM6|nr:rh201 [macacine betaherpesvirus 3]AAP50722.1 rh201 [macacine betaherpesvirus 3]QMS44109.1 Rh201 [synthetic construct]QQL10132.1 Cy201 [Cynomolgus cytomegalovirus]QQL10670.1 Rh201 [Rhesus cytomegalovirus strain 68-1.2]QQL10854.1 Rh201 [Rhesus cytomegalovirus strain 68-1_FL]
MVEQENAENNMESAPSDSSPLMVTPEEAVVWFKNFVVWLRVYGVYTFALTCTFAIASLIWLGYPQNQNLCVNNHSTVLTLLVPLTCMVTSYLLGARHPSNLTVLFFYICVNLVPTILFNICSEGYVIVTAYIMSVATFIAFTGLTFIAGLNYGRWKWIIGMYIIVLALFLTSTAFQSAPWHTKLTNSISAFSISFFAFILAYDTYVVIYQSSFMYCIRGGIRLYVDTIAIFLVIIFMMSMPKWVEHAKNSTLT